MNLFDPRTFDAIRKPLLEAETLPPECYTSEAFFKREIETIFMKVWNFIGRVDYIPNSGDYYTLDFAGVPLVILRDDNGCVHAFVNSCRHRGAKVVTGSGTAKALKCGYHGWIYRTDGSLAACPGMANSVGFDKADYPLVAVKTETWGGFIFVNFDRESESLASYLGNLPETFDCYRFENMVCTRRNEYEVACNWKIYVENAMEAFHVPHVHRGSINRQRGSVAVTEALLQHAQVTARTARITLRQGREQLLGDDPVVQIGQHLAACMQTAALTQSDQLLDDRTQILGLGQSGLNLLVLDQRNRHVREHRLAVGRRPVELTPAHSVSHFLSPCSERLKPSTALPNAWPIPRCFPAASWGFPCPDADPSAPALP